MPPPAKNFLTPSQVTQLQRAIKENELAHVREKILIILLQNDGRTQKEISNFLGCSLRTVAYWCRHGDPDKLESLHNKREHEHYRKAPTEYIDLLLKVEQSPSASGYEFGRWTAERLATYLTEKTGIELSSSQVRRILKRKKYSYIWARSRRAEYSGRRSRAAKYDLKSKQDPIERALFQERQARLFSSS